MIVGFHFTKLHIEQHSPLKGKVSVNNNIDISQLTEHDYSLKNKQKTLNFHFVFTVDYQTNIGQIALEGDVTYLADEQRVKQILQQWKSKKKIPPEESTLILNAALTRCNIKALELSQELNLPPHLPLPKVNFQTQSLAENYIG
jgi:hypothetical protein